MTLTLYYALGSPPSRAVLMTLMNLEIDFETKIINLAAGDHKSEEYLKINPQGTIPTVVDDDFVMNESRAIMCYLVNAKSPNHSLYPVDDAKARFIIDHRMFFDASTFMPACLAALGPIRKGETVVQQEHKDKIYSALQIFEEFLEGQEWFSAAENPSIADLSILANFATIYHAGVNIGSYPNIAAWYERCSALPGFAENENGAQMFGNFVKSKLTEPF